MPMNRAVDVLADPQVAHRKLFTDMVHPALRRCDAQRDRPAPYRHIPPAELRPAPTPGEHTREICHKVLALGTEEIVRLIAEGVLFTPPLNQPLRARVFVRRHAAYGRTNMDARGRGKS